MTSTCVLGIDLRDLKNGQSSARPRVTCQPTLSVIDKQSPISLSRRFNELVGISESHEAGIRLGRNHLIAAVSSPLSLRTYRRLKSAERRFRLVPTNPGDSSLYLCNPQFCAGNFRWSFFHQQQLRSHRDDDFVPRGFPGTTP